MLITDAPPTIFADEAAMTDTTDRADRLRALVRDRLADGTYTAAEGAQPADAIDAAVADGHPLAMDQAAILLGQLGGAFVRLAGTTGL